ncbi:plasmid stability protein [Azospirillum sp. RWY-5-1]|uniref:Plasmid stability protein n=1 Tax=Azospirillum oleiclasticum TaxID=2735135 RepID=A0ABX2T8U2_9PROT|nr:plasmid stability protein [Azospirillum oleiclasticum]NYZ13443.1 plasmid stability protein [Azospirillum oleiclasticum]NYZ20604.1 plasmid stability protein [Azospirillum oleiclasticum]
MGNLLVRNLSDETIHRLKERAALHGRSVEAEHRAVLEEAMTPVRTGADLWDSLSRCDTRLLPGELESSADQTPRPAEFD